MNKPKRISMVGEEELQRIKDIIGEVSRELEKLEKDCPHSWGELVYRPEAILKVVEGGVSEPVKYTMYNGYRRRWVRVCKLCCKQEFLYEEDLKNMKGNDS